MPAPTNMPLKTAQIKSEYFDIYTNLEYRAINLLLLNSPSRTYQVERL